MIDRKKQIYDLIKKNHPEVCSLIKDEEQYRIFDDERLNDLIGFMVKRYVKRYMNKENFIYD